MESLAPAEGGMQEVTGGLVVEGSHRLLPVGVPLKVWKLSVPNCSNRQHEHLDCFGGKI